MKCRECFEFILRYLDGELAPDEHSSFEVHMAKCPPCRRFQRRSSCSARRAGRWWWESEDAKECGLHAKDTSKSTAGVAA